MRSKIRQIIVMFSIMLAICFLIAGETLVNRKLAHDYQIELALEKKKNENILNNARLSYNSLYENNIPHQGITLEEVASSRLEIEKITLEENLEEKELMLQDLITIETYINIGTKINTIFIDGVLLSSTTEENITEINNDLASIKEEWKITYTEVLNTIDTQYKNIINAQNKVKKLYSDANMTKVKYGVTRRQHNDALITANKLPQKDIKDNLNVYLDKVLETIEKREEEARRIAEEKARKEAAIAAAWVTLNAPYISQNLNEIFNGCEAASLLMGLQYKGYLTGTSLRTFADNMPKSDNPHTGFFRDIYSREPLDVPHWIAPEALAKYGVSASGNSQVVNITGATVEQLEKEIAAGNPVVVYVTNGYFNEPINWVEEVPQNLHVMLLIGYNLESKQLLLHNPWTRNDNGKIYVDIARFTTIYNTIGKKAVVIR